MLPPFPSFCALRINHLQLIQPVQGLATLLRLTKVVDKETAGEEASHVGGLLIDDLGVWLVGDEPVAKSAGAARMKWEPFLPLMNTDRKEFKSLF